MSESIVEAEMCPILHPKERIEENPPAIRNQRTLPPPQTKKKTKKLQCLGLVCVWEVLGGGVRGCVRGYVLEVLGAIR